MAALSNELSRPLLIYTATAGLGDYLVMGAVIRALETSMPGLKCLLLHRNNPHVALWPYGDHSQTFYNIYAPAEWLRFLSNLKQHKKNGAVVFGLQMAPGSMQGFMCHKTLKALQLVDYIVDFNLINADIVLPARHASYIIDLHLEQAVRLLQLKKKIKASYLEPPLRREPAPCPPTDNCWHIGIHPWSRRGTHSSFVWDKRHWLETIRFLLAAYPSAAITIFGRDHGFGPFKEFMQQHLADQPRLTFLPSRNVAMLASTIESLDMLISVNTSAVHLGFLLGKPMVVLAGPSLDIWSPPENEKTVIVRDEDAVFPGNDRWIEDSRFPQLGRIKVEQVKQAIIAVGNK